METFLQMLAKYPEFAKKAQLEIDVVTLQQRLPTLDDRKSIPMVDCIMREVFRFVISTLSLAPILTYSL